MIARLLTLLLLFSLIITQEALYPLVESLQDKKFYIYPFPVERWYAFPVSQHDVLLLYDIPVVLCPKGCCYCVEMYDV